jgi:hypothetical protein
MFYKKNEIKAAHKDEPNNVPVPPTRYAMITTTTGRPYKYEVAFLLNIAAGHLGLP